LPGFGLRISPVNRRTWICTYRVGGRQVMETIGTLAVIPKTADARERARQSLLKARDGIDPVAEKKAKKAQAEHDKAVQTFTFRRLADAYIEEYCRPNTKPSTLVEVSRHLDHAARFFGSKPLREITESDIVDLISLRNTKPHWAPNGGRSEADNRLVIVRRCLRWAKKTINPETKERYVTADVSADIARPMNYNGGRERVLDDGEIVKFWRACGSVEEGGIGWPFGPVFKLLLLTAQRRDEVAGMCWSELDIEGKVWHLPGSRTKNRKAHDVHLSDQAIEIIESLPRIEPLSGRPDFVFTTTRCAPVSGFASAKAQVSKRMGVADADWRLHDLRRTYTTGMARLGIAEHVADKVLNHTSGTISGVKRIYC
jgi:integrase